MESRRYICRGLFGGFGVAPDTRIRHRNGRIVYKLPVAVLAFERSSAEDYQTNLCAYFTEKPDFKVGRGYMGSFSDDGFSLSFFERTLHAGSPLSGMLHVYIGTEYNWETSWNKGRNVTVRIHMNREDGIEKEEFRKYDHVTAIPADGIGSVTVHDVKCGHHEGRVAFDTDPYVDVTFGPNGNVISIVQPESETTDTV